MPEETHYGTMTCPEPVGEEGAACGLTADVFDMGTTRVGTEFEQYRSQCPEGHHRFFDADFDYLVNVTPDEP